VAAHHLGLGYAQILRRKIRIKRKCNGPIILEYLSYRLAGKLARLYHLGWDVRRLHSPNASVTLIFGSSVLERRLWD
jgi:hypothetical protein